TSEIYRENPYQILFHQFFVTIFHPFRCPAYTHILKEQCRGNFHFHGWKCIMICYTHRQQAYKNLDLEHQTTISAHGLAPWNNC
ncbi:hypothetical protein PAXRUDRAFT_157208, partial [Paxillus rubicundulus Ve08.2h10]